MKTTLLIVIALMLGGCAKEIHEAKAPAAEPHGSVLAQTSKCTSNFCASTEPSCTAAGLLLSPAALL